MMRSAHPIPSQQRRRRMRALLGSGLGDAGTGRQAGAHTLSAATTALLRPRAFLGVYTGTCTHRISLATRAGLVHACIACAQVHGLAALATTGLQAGRWPSPPSQLAAAQSQKVGSPAGNVSCRRCSPCHYCPRAARAPCAALADGKQAPLHTNLGACCQLRTKTACSYINACAQVARMALCALAQSAPLREATALPGQPRT